MAACSIAHLGGLLSGVWGVLPHLWALWLMPPHVSGHRHTRFSALFLNFGLSLAELPPPRGAPVCSHPPRPVLLTSWFTRCSDSQPLGWHCRTSHPARSRLLWASACPSLLCDCVTWRLCGSKAATPAVSPNVVSPECLVVGSESRCAVTPPEPLSGLGCPHGSGDPEAREGG